MNEVLFLRVKKLLAEKKMTQGALAIKLGIDYSNLWRKFKGKRKLDMELLQKIAQELDTSIGFLTGEQYIDSIIPLPAFENDPQFIETNPAAWKMLPLYKKYAPDCADIGGFTYAKSEIDSWHCFSTEIFGKWNSQNPPYLIHVEGDSMENANIHDGSIVIVNPDEEISDGDSALVYWNGDNAAIKLVYRLPSGAVELHAANPLHKKIYTFTKEEIDDGKLEIKGKIMWAGQKPKRMK